MSVIIPTYGRPELLERAVKSVLSQTYERIELLLIDDHSPTPVEDSLGNEILADSRVTVTRLAENRGANVARKTGIDKATGEYVAFLDDDDVWKEEKLQRQLDVFVTGNPDTGVVFTGLEHVDEKGRVLGQRIPTANGWVTKQLLSGMGLAQFSTVMVHSDAINRAGLPDERFPSWQDREWYIRLSQQCAFESIPEPLVQKLSSDHEQIGDDYESKRDVSFPLFLAVHRETARSYGRVTERRFIASKTYQLGRSALKNGYYSDARECFLYSIYAYPFRLSPVLNLVAVIGGSRTYELSRYVGEKLNIA